MLLFMFVNHYMLGICRFNQQPTPSTNFCMGSNITWLDQFLFFMGSSLWHTAYNVDPDSISCLNRLNDWQTHETEALVKLSSSKNFNFWIPKSKHTEHYKISIRIFFIYCIITHTNTLTMEGGWWIYCCQTGSVLQITGIRLQWNTCFSIN